MSSRKRNGISKRMCCLSSDNRKEETVITCLHIGHSFITHSFLLKGEQLSMCIGCDERLTIEHILLNCSDFIETRVILQLSHYELYLKIFQWNYL